MTGGKYIDKRFQELISIVGGNKKAAELIGKSEKSIERYKSEGLKNLYFEDLRKLLSAADKSFSWLITGSIGGEEEQGFIAIPVMDFSVSAGNGSLVERERVADVMHLNEAWLRSTFHVTPQSVTILPVKGDSMEPTIRSGELVLIEKIDLSGRPGDGIYIVRLDDTIAVKRLQSMPGGVIRVSSDNKHFEPYEIGPDDTVDFAVLGRVLAGLRAL
ncbi:S24 family peptidase [Sneathiella sp.]|uniref:S24 family peptidase n=1 Tax=Sneathiella sp. TaxID=1964365 RepID=UPI002FE29DD4